ncbi:hypothetical protein [Vibrio mediterranei]|uniref:hypothetical protein n=1 Tax=Vibrio mediterranei TaxID=689 RepID=UPI001EFD6665|nr:hypothetical protein [Vibrio mediterranei]MCG9657604.1 hypothetical protein [Vibrio mediterranei]
MKKSIEATYALWMAPTCNQVESIFVDIAIRYALASTNYVHKLIGKEERTAQLWRANGEEQSSIQYRDWALLVALAKHKLIIGEPYYSELNKRTVMSWDTYTPPSKEDVEKFFGKGSYTNRDRAELAHLLGLDRSTLSRQKGALPFNTYALLALLSGAKIDWLFPIENPTSIGPEVGKYVVLPSIQDAEKKYLTSSDTNISYQSFLKAHNSHDNNETKAEYVTLLQELKSTRERLQTLERKLGCTHVEQYS